MPTASHDPPTDNGIKISVGGQEYDCNLERSVETRVEADASPTDWDGWGVTRTSGIPGVHRDVIVEFTGQYGADLDGLPVTVDCGSGMSALGTPQVLRGLGIHAVTLNEQMNGHFPGRESKPTPETLADLTAFVIDGDFDFGIGRDGDTDHTVIIDGDGEVVHEDTAVATVAEHYVRVSDAEGPAAVTTLNASGHVDEWVHEARDRVERVRLGVFHEGIASARVDDGDVVFAAESWKHIHPSLGGWVDGVTSTALVARLTAESGTADLHEPITERPYRKVSVPCPDENRWAATATLETLFPEVMAPESVDTEYGVRLKFADVSRTLVRLFGTELYTRVHPGADNADTLIDEVTAVVEGEVEAA